MPFLSLENLKIRHAQGQAQTQNHGSTHTKLTHGCRLRPTSMTRQPNRDNPTGLASPKAERRLRNNPRQSMTTKRDVQSRPSPIAGDQNLFTMSKTHEDRDPKSRSDLAIPPRLASEPSFARPRPSRINDPATSMLPYPLSANLSRSPLHTSPLVEPAARARRQTGKPASGGAGQWWSRTESNRRPPACKAGALPTELRPPRRAADPRQKRPFAKEPGLMVGLGRLELPTSRLSGVRSNRLSYRPQHNGRGRQRSRNRNSRKGRRCPRHRCLSVRIPALGPGRGPAFGPMSGLRKG